MFIAGGLVAYWYAPDEGPAPHAGGRAFAPQVTPPSRVSERVEEMLAQGGCPGWIALANDAALQSQLDGTADRGKVYHGPLRETAAHEPAPPPRVQYPVPLRVAALMRTPSALGSVAGPEGSADLPGSELTPLPPVNGDDLISEEEDLLLESPEIAGSRSSTAEPQLELPADAAASGTLPDASDATSGSPADELLDGADDLLAPTDAATDGSGTQEGVDPSGKTPPSPLPPTADDAEDLLNDHDDLLEPAAPGPAAPRRASSSADCRADGTSNRARPWTGGPACRAGGDWSRRRPNFRR